MNFQRGLCLLQPRRAVGRWLEASAGHRCGNSGTSSLVLRCLLGAISAFRGRTGVGWLQSGTSDLIVHIHTRYWQQLCIWSQVCLGLDAKSVTLLGQTLSRCQVLSKQGHTTPTAGANVYWLFPWAIWTLLRASQVRFQVMSSQSQGQDRLRPLYRGRN